MTHDPLVLIDQNIIQDTSSMCSVVMNSPKGNSLLESTSSMQMFLIGGLSGETYNQW